MLAILGAAVGLGSGLGGLGFFPLTAGPEDERIFLALRLPRVAMGLLVGTGLAISGALSQAILRNPLASPFTLGISSGAAFGAALGIFAGVASIWGLALSAFVFAALTTGGVLLLARYKGGRPETLVLGGVAIMFLFASSTSLLQYMATEQQLQSIVFWGFGNLGRAGWPEVLVAGILILAPAPAAMRLAWDLDVLAAGEETASSLGTDVRKLRLAGVLLISVMSAGSICFTGLIGFVGLVAPHMTRLFLGADHRYLIPGSAFLGATLLTFSDALSRTLWSPQVVPIGILTSFLGVPFFFWLLLRRGSGFY